METKLGSMLSLTKVGQGLMSSCFVLCLHGIVCVDLLKGQRATCVRSQQVLLVNVEAQVLR